MTTIPSLPIALSILSDPASAWKGEVLVLPVYKDGFLPSPTQQIDRALKGAIRERMARDRFEGEAEKTLWLDLPGVSAGRILLTSLGSRGEISRSTLRDAYGAAAKAIAERQIEEVALAWIGEKGLSSDFDAAVEGFFLGSYRFDRYRKEASARRRIAKVTVVGVDPKGLKKVSGELSRTKVISAATCFARDLVNEPANVVTPSYLEKVAGKIAREKGLRIEVLAEKDLRRLGMNLVLAVGMGSSEKARMVHLEYRPKEKKARSVVLVGKGVTFDSGGLSLKSQANMYGMKCDMSGAAAVLAAAWGVAELALPVHLHVLIPLVENLPSGHSAKPGDVVIGANGKSVEIENTDAEGRLILADALCYAGKFQADWVIDVATLTGAVVVALGEDMAGILGNDAGLIRKIESAAARAGEKLWELPLEKSYMRLLKSDVADLKNVGGKGGGTITGALFLREFAGDRPWAHLDIAGPAFIDREWSTCTKGGTGFAVRTFLELLAAQG